MLNIKLGKYRKSGENVWGVGHRAKTKGKHCDIAVKACDELKYAELDEYLQKVLTTLTLTVQANQDTKIKPLS